MATPAFRGYRPGSARVAVVSGEPAGDRPSGPSLRAAGLAYGLLAQGVPVVETVVGDDPTAAIAGAGIAVVNLSVAARSPELLGAEYLVVDAAGPYLVESLWVNGSRGAVDRRAILVYEAEAVARVLAAADLILVAHEAQRSLVLGLLLGRGLLRPELVDADPALAGLIATVPFGLTPHSAPLSAAPRAIAADDGLRLVWPGGLWDWLDPSTLVAGVAAARSGGADVRLELWGTGSPDPHAPRARQVAGLRRQIARASLAESVRLVDWVPYAEMTPRLAAVDLAVTLDPGGIEGRFAYRTRLVEALAAGVPVLATRGEEVAERAAAGGAGWTVKAGDVDGVAQLLTTLAGDPSLLAAARAMTSTVVADLGYDVLVEPVAAFCRAPRRQRPGPSRGRLAGRLRRLLHASRAPSAL